MIKAAIYDIVNGKDLSLERTREVMDQIMNGQATNAQIGSFLTAMRMKGETIDEITACAMVMRDKCTKIFPKTDVLDIVGTGGDEVSTFNISTVSALVIAAGGVPVAKHGNRSVSSKCGSADLLEALGVNIELSAEKSAALLDELGICFMFAPTYHASMKYAGPVRKELGIRTIFNILGPLANPAGANMQLLGVYDENLVEPLANVLNKLKVKRGMVVHGHDGLDEITLTDTTTICEIADGKINSFFITPEQLGLKRCELRDLIGGEKEENAIIARDILDGATGPKRDVVVLNSAFCLYMSYNDITLRDCVRMAEEIIDSGKAKAKLDSFVKRSNELAIEVLA
ncbi:anthranilate phosphoribosyltransferase [Acetobacterium malicum]|uniref:Anthranilate phosphoribosyltransferase n=1 Tax=Acetobacterium malicum TaxID=52692 RepID=A0ABR6YW25_9FIRM|nr:anthranilate phosphoribosyltransferase [Acetobacterium malicum]MBC3899402.1 anthranilate phosphoribosyltransferase [Acetobacterium malicum]